MHMLFLASLFVTSILAMGPPVQAIYEFYDGVGAVFSNKPTYDKATQVRKAFCLYNSNVGSSLPFQHWFKSAEPRDHHYTGNMRELGDGRVAPDIGFKDVRGGAYAYQGWIGFISQTKDHLQVPLYRSVNSKNRHYFALDLEEVKRGPKNVGGYNPEPIAGYAFPPMYC